jgi:WD40 repeat protein
MLLAVQAADQTYAVDGTLLPESETALHQALRHASRLLLTIPAQDNSLPYVYFSPDGNRLIAHYFPAGSDPLSLPDGTVTRIWDAYSGELLYTLPAGVVVPQWPPGEQVAMVEFTDENELLVNFWNTIDGTVSLPSILDVPKTLAFDLIDGMVLNPDLSAVAISWIGGTKIGVWSLLTGDNELTINTLAEETDYFGGSGGPVFLHTTLPTHLFLPENGKHLITIHEITDEDQTYVLTWDRETGVLLAGYLIYEPEDKQHFFSPSQDGEMLAVPFEGHIGIRDMASQDNLTLMLSPRSAAYSVMTFSPDGSLFAAASLEGIIYIWDLNTSISSNSSQLLLALSDPVKDVYDLDFSPDGTRLSSVAADGSITVWDIRPNGGAELPAIGKPSFSEQNQQISMALSPDGRQLAIARPGETVTIWDPVTREPLFELPGGAGSIEDISFSPDGSLIATCSHAGPLILWDAENGQQLGKLDGYTEAGCTLDFHRDGSWLALGFYKNAAGWYQVLEIPDFGKDANDPIDLKIPFPWRGTHQGETTEMAFNPNGNQVAGTTSIGEFYLWDPWLENPESTEGYIVIDQSILLQGSLNYQDVVFNPEGDRLITPGINGAVTIWDTHALEVILTIPAHNGKVTAAVFIPDGSTLATGSTDREIKFWDIKTGQNLLTLSSNTGSITKLIFSPDGSRLYAAGADGTVQVYLLDIDELVEMAKSGLSRSLTQEECQMYLHLDECPKE